MSVIGDQIKKYRLEKGITQEQLGQLVGVTTQAVSRWERGGTPDAEILPLISEVLGVSIDALFGRGEQSVALSLARRLCRLPKDKAYRYAFNICWAIEIGMCGDISILDDFMNKLLDSPADSSEKKTDYYAKVIEDNGVALARISPGFRHFFLMEESGGSINKHLAPTDDLRRVFSLFSDEKMLRIIFYIYSNPNIPMAASLIAKSTGYGIGEVERCMEVLCKNSLADRTVVASVDGEINAYSFKKESFVIPLLCFADEIAKKNVRTFMGSFDHKKPFL